MKLFIPVLYKGYKIIEKNIFIKFNYVLVTRNRKTISFELFQDENLTLGLYDYELEFEVKKNLWNLTLIPTDNKRERIRVPYYFAETFEEVLKLASSGKYKRHVDIKFKNPITFSTKYEGQGSFISLRKCLITISDGKYYLSCEWIRSESPVEFDIDNVKSLKIGTYFWGE